MDMLSEFKQNFFLWIISIYTNCIIDDTNSNTDGITIRLPLQINDETDTENSS